MQTFLHFFQRKRTLPACFTVLRLHTPDTLITQSLITTHVHIGKLSAFYKKDLYTQ